MYYVVLTVVGNGLDKEFTSLDDARAYSLILKDEYSSDPYAEIIITKDHYHLEYILEASEV